MSAEETRGGAAYDEIAAAVFEARGEAIMRRIANPDPHAEDLPIVDYRTGKIAAYVSRQIAEGLLPVVRNGLVVGYYKETEDGSAHPTCFFDGLAIGLSRGAAGERWMATFGEDGSYVASVLL